MLIDYVKLEKAIIEVEEILKGYDQEETQLILRKVAGRIATRQQQQQIKENMANTLPKFVRKFLNKQEDDKDGGEV